MGWPFSFQNQPIFLSDCLSSCLSVPFSLKPRKTCRWDYVYSRMESVFSLCGHECRSVSLSVLSCLCFSRKRWPIFQNLCSLYNWAMDKIQSIGQLITQSITQSRLSKKLVLLVTICPHMNLNSWCGGEPRMWFLVRSAKNACLPEYWVRM